MGGERFDPRLERQLSGFFPNARFRNIYASTEAGSLFSSNGDTWRIPEDLTKFVKTSPDGELLLHRDILASFEWNQNSGDTDWYRTGDLVEIFGPDEFRIVGRLVEQINVGGFKVNPHEVETEIRSVAGVVDCRVFGRSNSVVGNIVCVDVVSESSVDTKSIELLIRTRLGKVFQPWQIPRVFRFVEHLESSKSGKVKRL
jgi:acyl-CoA synthetase (AMP-forming)/AMP-acid ligase II